MTKVVYVNAKKKAGGGRATIVGKRILGGVDRRPSKLGTMLAIVCRLDWGVIMLLGRIAGAMRNAMTGPVGRFTAGRGLGAARDGGWSNIGLADGVWAWTWASVASVLTLHTSHWPWMGQQAVAWCAQGPGARASRVGETEVRKRSQPMGQVAMRRPVRLEGAAPSRTRGRLEPG